MITGIIAGVVFLGFCLLGGMPYHLLVLAMAFIGYFEFIRMIKVPPFGAAAILGYAGVLMFMFPWKLTGLALPFSWEQGIWMLLLLLMIITVTSKNAFSVNQAALLFLGAVYVGMGFFYMTESRQSPDGNGVFWTFLLLASIWASDAGAYFVGRKLGKNKLWPAISPNKTIEGAVGGIVIAIITAVCFSLFSGGILSIGRAVVIGLSCAVVGQFGDLIQSAYKRKYEIKDSGTLLPGHGGILDRCDSWIIVFPFVHILLLMPY